MLTSSFAISDKPLQTHAYTYCSLHKNLHTPSIDPVYIV